AVQVGEMGLIDVALVRLEVIAILEILGREAKLLASLQVLEIGDQGRFARPQVRKNEPGPLDAWIRQVVDLLMEGAARGLTRLLQAASVEVVKPAMVDAAQATVLQATVAEISP